MVAECQQPVHVLNPGSSIDALEVLHRETRARNMYHPQKNLPEHAALYQNLTVLDSAV